jgi:hypothetical protein
MTAASRALLSRAALSPLLAVASRRVALLLRPLATAVTILPCGDRYGPRDEVLRHAAGNLVSAGLVPQLEQQAAEGGDPPRRV